MTDRHLRSAKWAAILFAGMSLTVSAFFWGGWAAFVCFCAMQFGAVWGAIHEALQHPQPEFLEASRLRLERDEARRAAIGYAQAGIEEGLWEEEECDDIREWCR